MLVDWVLFQKFYFALFSKHFPLELEGFFSSVTTLSTEYEPSSFILVRQLRESLERPFNDKASVYLRQ